GQRLLKDHCPNVVVVLDVLWLDVADRLAANVQSSMVLKGMRYRPSCEDGPTLAKSIKYLHECGSTDARPYLHNEHRRHWRLILLGGIGRPEVVVSLEIVDGEPCQGRIARLRILRMLDENLVFQ